MTVPLFVALYCLEAGLFFTVVPWTRVWTMNPLLHKTAAMAIWADNPFLRGFVTGVGVAHILVGVRDLITIVRARRDDGGES